jgi:hypothetical protein
MAKTHSRDRRAQVGKFPGETRIDGSIVAVLLAISEELIQSSRMAGNDLPWQLACMSR